MFRLIPSKKVREETKLTYELKGVQKAVNFLSRYYRIRRMNIIVDGRQVGKGNHASYDYDTYTAYFTKRTLNKLNVFHEFYHHIVNIKNWDMTEKTEERKANSYVRRLLSA